MREVLSVQVILELEGGKRRREEEEEDVIRGSLTREAQGSESYLASDLVVVRWPIFSICQPGSVPCLRRFLFG